MNAVALSYPEDTVSAQALASTIIVPLPVQCSLDLEGWGRDGILPGYRPALQQCKFAAGPELGIELEEVPVAPGALLWQ